MTEQQIPTSEVLNRAADLIEKRGWAQGDWSTDSAFRPLCLEGALMAAMGRTQGYFTSNLCPAGQAVRAHLGLGGDIFVDGLRLYDWNDAESRTADEVIATLRAVAVIEAAREQQPAEATS